MKATTKLNVWEVWPFYHQLPSGRLSILDRSAHSMCQKLKDIQQSQMPWHWIECYLNICVMCKCPPSQHAFSCQMPVCQIWLAISSRRAPELRCWHSIVHVLSAMLCRWNECSVVWKVSQQLSQDALLLPKAAPVRGPAGSMGTPMNRLKVYSFLCLFQSMHAESSGGSRGSSQEMLGSSGQSWQDEAREVLGGSPSPSTSGAASNSHYVVRERPLQAGNYSIQSCALCPCLSIASLESLLISSLRSSHTLPPPPPLLPGGRAASCFSTWLRKPCPNPYGHGGAFDHIENWSDKKILHVQFASRHWTLQGAIPNAPHLQMAKHDGRTYGAAHGECGGKGGRLCVAAPDCKDTMGSSDMSCHLQGPRSGPMYPGRVLTF